MVMPDHIHTVFQLQNKQTLPTLIQSFKKFTAKHINAKLARKGSLWQASYYEHGIRRDESLNKITRYCYENPVRKGLVAQPKDYPYWRCKFEMECTPCCRSDLPIATYFLVEGRDQEIAPTV